MTDLTPTFLSTTIFLNMIGNYTSCYNLIVLNTNLAQIVINKYLFT